jgi:natural product precursor
MKPSKKRGKLSLDKEVIAKLQSNQMKLIIGGKATTTTSETYTCPTNTANGTC